MLGGIRKLITMTQYDIGSALVQKTMYIIKLLDFYGKNAYRKQKLEEICYGESQEKDNHVYDKSFLGNKLNRTIGKTNWDITG